MPLQTKFLRQTFFIFCVLSFSSLLQAQWAKVWGGKEGDILTSIRQMDSGDFIATGYTQSFGDGNSHVLVLKISSAGKFRWEKTYGGTRSEIGRCIRQSSDGGFVVVGDTTSTREGSSDILVLKLSANGRIKWQKTYGTKFDSYARNIIEASDENFVVAGYTWDYHNCIWILKINSNKGKVIWQKKYDTGADASAYCIQQTMDGGFIVGGQYKENAWVMKLDSLGEIEWRYTYGKKRLQSVTDIRELSDGSFIFCSYCGPDIWVVKLKSDGKIDWQKLYTGKDYDYPYALDLTSDNGIIIAGLSASFGKMNTSETDNCDFFIMKLDATGNIGWQKIYGGDYSRDIPYSIQETFDGGFIVGGGTQSWGAGYVDAWIVKLYSNGDITPLSAFINEGKIKIQPIKINKRNRKAEVSDTYVKAKKSKLKKKNIKGEIYSLGLRSTHTLTIEQTDNGTVYPAPGTYVYNNGEEAEIYAQPDSDYNFAWDGHVYGYNGPNPLKITMDGDKKVIVVFSEPLVWAGLGGGGMGSVKISESQNSKTVVFTGLGLLLAFMTVIYFISSRRKREEFDFTAI